MIRLQLKVPAALEVDAKTSCVVIERGSLKPSFLKGPLEPFRSPKVMFSVPRASQKARVWLATPDAPVVERPITMAGEFTNSAPERVEAPALRITLADKSHRSNRVGKGDG